VSANFKNINGWHVVVHEGQSRVQGERKAVGVGFTKLFWNRSPWSSARVPDLKPKGNRFNPWPG